MRIACLACYGAVAVMAFAGLAPALAAEPDKAQIDAIRPRVLVALGRVAAQTLLGNDTPIGRMRGQWFAVRGVPVMVTYHPAALLRNPSLKRPTWEDMQQVRDRLRAVEIAG